MLPVLAGVCWGSSGVFVRFMDSAGFENMTITFCRLSVTAALTGLVILVTDRGLFRVSLRDLPLLAFTGIMGYCFMNLCYNASINTLSLSLASVLLCTAPVYVILIGAVIFKEKITGVKVFCMVLALFGCVLLSGALEDGGLRWSVFGLAMGVLCSICNAVCTLGCNEASGVRGLHPLTIMFYNSLFGVIPMVFMADLSQITAYVSAEPLKGAALIVLNSLIGSLLPNLFFNISFKYLESGVVSILASGAEPTAAMVFGILLFSEIPTFWGFVGMVIVIGSIIVLTSSKNERKSDSECKTE